MSLNHPLWMFKQIIFTFFEKSACGFQMMRYFLTRNRNTTMQNELTKALTEWMSKSPNNNGKNTISQSQSGSVRYWHWNKLPNDPYEKPFKWDTQRNQVIA